MALVIDIAINDKISFSSKLSTDLNRYYGTVVGEVTYKIAKSYTDIYTYNSNVRATDSTVPQTELLTFIMIELIDPISDATKFMIPFAVEWIDEPFLNIIATDSIATLEVFDVDAANSSDVVDLLRSAGFKSRIISIR